MKISNSKKQLAKIISENGGWREGSKFSAQDYDGDVFFYYTKPTRNEGVWRHSGVLGGDWIVCSEPIKDWRQTILSRDEYLHLYPTRDADGMPSEINNLTQVGDTDVFELKPTIEQLAAEYKAKLEIAHQAQEEAYSRRDEAEAALEKLYKAGLEIGLDIAIASYDSELEHELVITDWRDLQVGDVIVAIRVLNVERLEGCEGVVVGTQDNGERAAVLARFNGDDTWWVKEWRFIRRP